MSNAVSCGNEQLLAERVHRRFLLDGHGDLRPEHIWLIAPFPIIDCLEFDARLRASDALDEIAFLHLECERLGGRWVGEGLRRHLAVQLDDKPSSGLFLFYRIGRAMLRARLSIAHLSAAGAHLSAAGQRLNRALGQATQLLLKFRKREFPPHHWSTSAISSFRLRLRSRAAISSKRLTIPMTLSRTDDRHLPNAAPIHLGNQVRDSRAALIDASKI